MTLDASNAMLEGAVDEALRQNVARFFEGRPKGPAAACWFDEHLDFEIVIAY
jgi:hypothetical protein